jgi:hypothetical protein
MFSAKSLDFSIFLSAKESLKRKKQNKKRTKPSEVITSG